jgi:hypothetical protein
VLLPHRLIPHSTEPDEASSIRLPNTPRQFTPGADGFAAVVTGPAGMRAYMPGSPCGGQEFGPGRHVRPARPVGDGVACGQQQNAGHQSIPVNVNASTAIAITDAARTEIPRTTVLRPARGRASSVRGEADMGLEPV